MGLSIKGYVLEPPRVGAANAPYTYTPNNFISDPAAWGLIYDDTESQPRADYFVLVLKDGSELVPSSPFLINARFGWTKNEVVQRFDYEARDQRFRTLVGAPITNVGILTVDANTTRLKITSPIQVWADAPFRLALGALPGTTWTLTPVAVFTFPEPPLGTVEVNPAGELSWNSGDLIAPNLGQTVWFQRQQFYAANESNGKIGVIDDPLYLNPLPASGQFPLIRIGFGLWLTPIEVGSPASGQVRWDSATGGITFNAADVTANTGKPVYYDGVLCGYNLSLPTYNLGAMPPGGNMTLPVEPAAGGDIVFRATSTTPPIVTVQFPITTRVAGPTDPIPGTLDPVGKAGYVQVQANVPGTMDVLFSTADRALYLGWDITVVVGDLSIERGISMRFFRCSANLDASDSTVKDVAAFYSVTDAVLADPVIGSPIVSLPAVPIDDGAHTLEVWVKQGTGTFPEGMLTRLDGPTEVVAPGVTTGYTFDFDGRQLQYAQRKNYDGSSVPDLLLEVPSGAAQLPDALLSSSYLHLSLDTGAGFVPLNIGTDALIDLLGGVVSFVTTSGELVPTAGGGHATFSGTTLSDVAGAFTSVLPGDLVVLPSNPSEAVYTVTAVHHWTFLQPYETITTDVATPSPLTDVAYEVHRNREVLADRFWQEAEPVDPNTKVERVRGLGAIVAAPLLALPTPFRNGVSVFFADTVTVTTVPNDSKFTPSLPVNQVEVSLATGNLNLTRADVDAPRFRFGTTEFSTSVVMVKDGSLFTPPATLPSQEVEVSLATGECNFSSTDFGKTAYWVKKLRRKVDYRLTAHLGFIEFTERMMMAEEALVTYAPLLDGVAQPVIEEPSTWIIRKEVTPPRTQVVSTVSFNPAGRRVAADPAPAVFRGGRPQDSTQVQVDTTNSTILFKPDKILTNVLPHGSNVGIDERIYIDYYVYDAVGGEKTTTVLQPPMNLATVSITENSPSFVIKGDQTTVFPANYLLRVEQDDAYLIGTSVYDSAEDQTTVTLAYGAVFRASLNDPKLYVASGPTPLSGGLWWSAYFGTEINAYDTVARGMNQLAVASDRTSVYRVGTVVAFTDAGGSFFDTYLISGATYDAATDRTKITLTQNVLRQYTSGAGGAILRYTVRPLLDDQTKQAQASRTPIKTEPYAMYRRLAGQPGVLLQSPADYTLDDAGLVKFSSPLLPGEEMVLFYTGHRIVPAMSKLRASYTATIVPTAQNGLADQKLTMNYWLYSPDTFYFRVEKLSNFQAEVAEQFQSDAKGSSPSGGPTTSNASQPALYEQGRESLFFPEGHLANADIVMRGFLKFFNDAVNYLEDALQDIDGRMVGDADGRLLFDGTTGNTRTTWAAVTNQIDDLIKVSEFPVRRGPIPPFPPVLTFVGTYQKAYLPGRWSRFFPMYRASLSGFTSGGSDTGDEIADLGWTNLTAVGPAAYWRWPRAAVLRSAETGDTVLYVDNATGASDPVVRPPFSAGNVCIIADRTTTYVPDTSPITVTGTAPAPSPGDPEQLLVSALPFDVPAGATVFICTTGPSPDTTYPKKTYRVGQDVGVNLEGGKLTFCNAFWPLDGSVPLIPPELCVHEVGAGECLQLNGVYCNNVLLAPYRFPALDGKNISDCGDQSIPMFVSTENEGVFLSGEKDAIAALQAATIPTSVISGGTLDVLLTTISTVAPLPLPAIQQFDLVRITTGPNAPAGWRRITSFTANSITVDSPFPSADAGFDFIITAGANVLAPTAFVVIGPTVIQAAGTLAVLPNQTVIITNGTAAGTRRQIVTVTPIVGPATQITLDAAFTAGTSNTFRVSKHLSTFGPLTGLAAQTTALLGVLLTNDLPTYVASEIKAIDRLFDGNQPTENTSGIFTDILVPPLTTHPGTVSGNILTRSDGTDLSVVNTTHFVFIRSGGNMGIYSVASSTTATINITDTFPVAGAVSYRVVSVFGFTKPGLQDVMCVLKLDEAFVTSATTFQTLLTTLVPVAASPADASAFATGVTTDALNARLTDLAARNTSAIIDVLSGLMTSKEKLYDKRFVWIDARINRKSGQVSKQLASIVDRLVKTTEQQASLSKLVQIDKLLKPQPPTEAEEAAPPPPMCP